MVLADRRAIVSGTISLGRRTTGLTPRDVDGW
jgi:hypothetical protein